MSKRKTVFGLGKWVIDYVRETDRFPQQNKLTIINNEFQYGGGGSFNVLMNLANLKNDLTLHALGRIGNDTSHFLVESLQKKDIDTSLLQIFDNYKTSYSIVLSEAKEHTRSFLFYDSGIDDHYTDADLDDLTPAGLEGACFYIGYLNILRGLLKTDRNELRLISLLKKIKERKAMIVGDCTSLDHSDYMGNLVNLIFSVLPLVDIFFMNEIEFGMIVNSEVRNSKGLLYFDKLEKELDKLQQRDINLCVVHFPEGAYIIDTTEKIYVPSFPIDEKKIAGTLGAGDAFCAGVLNAFLDGKDKQTILKEGHALSHFNLQTALSVQDGITIDKVRNFVLSEGANYETK